MTGSILLVEDDATLVRSIARNLTQRGYAVRSAGTIAAALQTPHAERPDLVLLDIDLPDGSGWEVLRSLRAGSGADAAVIVMSALRPNARLAGEFQCMAVLEKPFPMAALMRLIGESLDHVAGQAPPEVGIRWRNAHD